MEFYINQPEAELLQFLEEKVYLFSSGLKKLQESL
jgi:hypothetical protein